MLVMVRERPGRDNNTERRRKKQVDLPPKRNRGFYLYCVTKLAAFTHFIAIRTLVGDKKHMWYQSENYTGKERFR